MYPSSAYSSSPQQTSQYYDPQLKASGDHQHPLGRPASMPSLYHHYSSASNSGTSGWQPPPLHPQPQPQPQQQPQNDFYSGNSEPNSLLSSPTPSSPPSNATSSSMLPAAYNTQHYFVPQTTAHHHYGLSYAPHSHHPHHPHPQHHGLVQRSKLTTTLWEDEGTVCYQVDAKGICVARRQDNDMINGTKLLNVAGMSRGKRDGILKNEKGRVVVKVGAMHLKGVWITFARAKTLAAQYKIQDILYPLFVDDPSVFLYSSSIQPPVTNASRFSNASSTFRQSSSWDKSAVDPSSSSSSSQSSFRSSGFAAQLSNNDDVYGGPTGAPHSHLDYRPHVGGLVGSAYPYHHHPQQQQTRNVYFAEDGLLDKKHDDALKHESTDYYGREAPTTSKYTSSPTTAARDPALAEEPVSPTSYRRGSLVMSVPGRVASPRHHPYNKTYSMPPSTYRIPPLEDKDPPAAAHENATPEGGGATENNTAMHTASW